MKKKYMLWFHSIISRNEVLELFADIPNSRAAVCYSNLGITEVKNNRFYCVGVTLFLDQTRNGLRWNPSAHFRAALSDIFEDAPSLHVLPRSNNVTRRLATGDRQFWPRQIPFWRCRNDPINAIAFYDLSSRRDHGLFLLSNREIVQFVSPSGVHRLSFRLLTKNKRRMNCDEKIYIYQTYKSK